MAKPTSEKNLFDINFEPQIVSIKWLRSMLLQIKKDRENNIIQDVHIHPIGKRMKSAFSKDDFTNLLKFIEFLPPNEKEMCWVIPSDLIVENVITLIHSLVMANSDFSTCLVCSKELTCLLQHVKKARNCYDKYSEQDYKDLLENSKVSSKLQRKKWYHEEAKERRISSYQENKDDILKRNQSYYTKNREKILTQKSSYYMKNKDRISEKKKAYYSENKQDMRQARLKRKRDEKWNDALDFAQRLIKGRKNTESRLRNWPLPICNMEKLCSMIRNSRRCDEEEVNKEISMLEEILRLKNKDIDSKIHFVETIIEDETGKWADAIEARNKNKLDDSVDVDSTFIECLWLNLNGYIWAEMTNLEDYWEENIMILESKMKNEDFIGCQMSIQKIQTKNEELYKSRIEEIHNNHKQKLNFLRWPQKKKYQNFSEHFLTYNYRGVGGIKMTLHQYCEICLTNKSVY